MKQSSTTLFVVAVLPFVLTGCDVAQSQNGDSLLTTNAPSARYEPRGDYIVLQIPTGAPKRWYTAGYPPTLSLRRFPNTPDPELALDLRKELGKNVLDPLRYEQDIWMPNQSDRVTRLVDAHFGTPAAPMVRVPEWDNLVATATVRYEPEDSLGTILKNGQKQLKSFKWNDWKTDWTAANTAKAELKLDDETLARGSVVYRRWCMQCHGPTGAGEAAHAVENGPMPRDYRRGVFKYTTSFPPQTAKRKGLGTGGKPRRADLLRIVRNGIDGTIMPAFPTLTEAELEDVVSYVIHLSVRGETELATMARMIKPQDDDNLFIGPEIDWLFMQNELFVLVNWQLADRNAIPIPPEPFTTEEERLKSAVRGYKLYNSTEFACGKCHSDYGRSQTLMWDQWATIVQPRNFFPGVFRGGRRGEDLYARIYGGISPSGMTAFHTSVTNAAPGTPDKIWDIVHFLQSLSSSRDRKRMQEMDSEVKIEP